MAWEQKNPGLALMSVAFAQEQVARLREMVDEIHSNPELKCLVGSKARILLAEAEAAFADIWAQSIEPRMREMLACLPPWLVLSAGDRQQLERSVAGVLDEFPYATWSELLWCLAVGALRPRAGGQIARGRKAKWAGVEGLCFVAEVETAMKLMGVKRAGKKGLRQAIATLRALAPQRYGKYTENALYAGYYLALPYYVAARAELAGFIEFAAQSGKKIAEYPGPIPTQLRDRAHRVSSAIGKIG